MEFHIIPYLIVILAAFVGAVVYWFFGRYPKWSNPVCYGLGLLAFGLILSFVKVT